MIKRLLLNIPRFYLWLQKLRNRLKGLPNDSYPRLMGNELEHVAEVMLSPGWNICYGKGLTHEQLESQFAEYVGVGHAVAVGSGGVGLQMSLRALGLKPGDEAIHQIDTCVANAFSVTNAMAVPIFADIDPHTLMLSKESIEAQIGANTKAIIPIHMWGNAQNMEMVMEVARQHNLLVVEDGCLALGATWKDKKVGSYGNVGVFSFGCLKPIQTGEGGMIVTNDGDLAKELRIIRSYGEYQPETGPRDNKVLSWNGRMSEILAAVAMEQLKGYPALLDEMEANVSLFRQHLQRYQGIKLVESPYKKAYTQVVFVVDPTLYHKSKLMDALASNGVSVWHANFELINGLSFYSKGEWKNWILKGDLAKIEQNYHQDFANARYVFEQTGLSLGKRHFLSKQSTLQLIQAFDKSLLL